MECLINTGRLLQTFLPKQTEIDKILKVRQRKVPKETHFPVTVKEIQAGYLVSPYFKDIYLHLTQNRLPHTKTAIRTVETLAGKYILLDSLLFKIKNAPEKETVLLAIPEVYADKIIMLYHSSLSVEHQGVIKTYLTISDKFFIPNLIHYLCSYNKGCHICQLQTRINLNYCPLSRLSTDLKLMPRSNEGYKYMLCIIDEVTNYLIIMEPIYQSRSEEIGDALIENIIAKYCVPEYIIMDQDSTFKSSLMNYLFKKLDIKINTVAPYNHQ